MERRRAVSRMLLSALATGMVLAGAAAGLQAAAPQPPPSRADLAAVDGLIKTWGKKPIVDLLRSKLAGRVTVTVDGRDREAVGPPNPEYVNARTILRDLARIPLSVVQLEQALRAAGPPPAPKLAITHEDAPMQSGAENTVFVVPCPEATILACAEENFRDRFGVVNPDAGLGHYTAWQEAAADGALQPRLEFSGSYTPPTELTPYRGSAAWKCAKGSCEVTLVVPRVRPAPR